MLAPPRAGHLFVGLTVVGLALSGCRSTEIERGSALLAPHGGSVFHAGPNQPGDGFVALVATLRNVSGQDIVLKDIRLVGTGIGEVLHVQRIDVAPRPGRYDRRPSRASWIPGGIYRTFPPVWQERGCLEQQLEPVAGYRLLARHEAFISVLVEVREEGRFAVDAHRVMYEVDGEAFRQDLMVGFDGHVDQDTEARRVDPFESRCVGPTGARLLIQQ